MSEFVKEENQRTEIMPKCTIKQKMLDDKSAHCAVV